MSLFHRMPSLVSTPFNINKDPPRACRDAHQDWLSDSTLPLSGGGHVVELLDLPSNRSIHLFLTFRRRAVVRRRSLLLHTPLCAFILIPSNSTRDAGTTRRDLPMLNHRIPGSRLRQRQHQPQPAHQNYKLGSKIPNPGILDRNETEKPNNSQSQN